MLKQRLELKAAEEEYQLDLEIAKAQARERVLAKIEEEEIDKNFPETHAKTESPALTLILPAFKPRDVTSDRVYYLDQHLIGEPKEMIVGCLHIAPDKCFQEGRRLLEKEYGDAHKVSTTYMQKLISWPGPALKRFSIFMTKCHKAMKTNVHLTVLDHPPNIQTIVLKFPANLQVKWRENGVRTRRKDNTVAGFGDLVEFVEYAAETANDPVYGKDALSKTKSQSIGVAEDNEKLPSFKPKNSSFATNLSTAAKPTKSLQEHLEATSTKTTLQLGTMHSQSLVKSAIVKDLIVTDLKGKSPVELPRAYTRQQIPADHKQIPTSDTVGRIEKSLERYPLMILNWKSVFL